MISHMSHSVCEIEQGISRKASLQVYTKKLPESRHHVYQGRSPLADFDFSPSCFSVWILGEGSLDGIIDIIVVICSIFGQDLVHGGLVENAADCLIVRPAWNLEHGSVIDGRARNLLRLSSC